MKLIKEQLNIDFLGKRRLAGVVSSLLIVAGIVSYFALGGLHYGIDFTGGTLVQVRFEEALEIEEFRTLLSQKSPVAFSLQSFGEEDTREFLITLSQGDAKQTDAQENPAVWVEDLLKETHPKHTIRRVESVGPKVGEELKESAFLAILLSLLLILLYIWVRFQWRYGIGAIVALFHDVLIVLGAFVITQKEISLPVVAAILTVAGYSINDTIVIFDRLRENLRRYRKRDVADVMNESINQTLSRTILTSGTTLFVLLSLYIFGGDIINDFAFALLIGVVVGTYSSIFIASPTLHLLMQRAKQSA